MLRAFWATWFAGSTWASDAPKFQICRTLGLSLGISHTLGFCPAQSQVVLSAASSGQLVCPPILGVDGAIACRLFVGEFLTILAWLMPLVLVHMHATCHAGQKLFMFCAPERARARSRLVETAETWSCDIFLQGLLARFQTANRRCVARFVQSFLISGCCK